MMNEFRRELDLAKRESKFPYFEEMIPQIDIVAGLVLSKDSMVLSNPILASRLLDCITFMISLT